LSLLWRLSVVGLAIAAAACNPDPRGRCSSSADCRTGSSCNTTLHLCEATPVCTPACHGGTVCSPSGTCSMPGVPSVTLEIAANALLSPSSNNVALLVVADNSVVLGGLSVAATAADGGVWASGMVVAAAAGDGGVPLTSFSSDSQGPASLVAMLSYTDSANVQHQVSSSMLPVRIDAVPPTLALSSGNLDAGPSSGGPINGWFARSFDGGITIDAVIDDTPTGSGPDGGTLKVMPCAKSSGCTVSGILNGAVDGGAGLYKFSFGGDVSAANSEGPVAYSVDAVDSAGNHVDQTGSVLIDGKAPATGSAIVVVNADAGTLGADGQLWFGAGTAGRDVEIALQATDNGVGLDVAGSTLTVAAGDFDPGQQNVFTGFQPAASAGGPDGSVHFIIHTGITSDREGPLRFSVAIFDKLGNAAPPIAGQILVDDLGPEVSVGIVNYSATTPARATVCAATVTCGRGAAGAEDHALPDDVVTVVLSVQDCGVGYDLGARPTTEVLAGGQNTNFVIDSALYDTGAGNCANGSTNLRYHFAVQIDLGKYAPLLTADASGKSEARAITVGYDQLGGQGFNGDDSTPAGTGGAPIEISRVRWKAALAGRATGDPALIPLDASAVAETPRNLVVAVEGQTPLTSNASSGLEVFDSTGAVVSQIALTSDGTHFDHATGTVAVGHTGSLWIAGTPNSCSTALNCTSNLWLVRLAQNASGQTSPILSDCVVSGAVGSLAVRNGIEGGIVETVLASIGTAGTQAQSAAAFSASIFNGALRCNQTDTTFRVGFATTTGISVANSNVFVSGQSGFYSLPVNGTGNFALATSQTPFTDSSGNALFALPAAPALLLTGTVISPYFGAVDSLATPSQQRLREATLSGATWVPAAAPWSNVAVSNPVLHTPVFDTQWLYTTDTRGVLQLSSLGVGNNDKVVTITSSPVSTSGGSSLLVSAPVLIKGNTTGSSALTVQANGIVNLVSLVPANGGGSPKLTATSQATVGAFTSATLAPPAPVLDARGTGSVAYVIDGGNCSATATCGTAAVWALQLGKAPVAASASTWPRPGHDSCNSRQADGACP
jgi:hypothetical protein